MTHVLIAQQLFTSMGKLTPTEQAHVRDFIQLFQENQAHPSFQLERVDRARSADVWSGRASKRLRVILYKDTGTWAILYADRHDPAYEWARRREIGRHTVTHALQIVVAAETVREVEQVAQGARRARTPALFGAHPDDYLLSLGVPASWIPTLRYIRDEDQLLEVCQALPLDVADRLITLATGVIVTPPPPVAADKPLAEAAGTHPEFYVVSDADELAAALAAPMEHWINFLHPSQRELVERDFKGPAKVSGSAGTGKTVVAMHRARHLARKGERVLLTSYVKILTENIRLNLRLLCTEDELSRITVATIHEQALQVIHQVDPAVTAAGEDVIPAMLENFRLAHAPGWTAAFVRAEWEGVVRPQGIDTLAAYRKASRKGRGSGISPRDRETLWKVFGGVLHALAGNKMLDMAGVPLRASELLKSGKASSAYTAVIVDEVQDLRPPEIKFVRALCARHPGNLMLCGDAGQRIYPGGFSLGELGIDVRGRSCVLRINYRTTEQIRRITDKVRGPVADDMDGGKEEGQGARSLLRGPAPLIRGYRSQAEELAAAVTQIRAWLARGLQGSAIAVLARSNAAVAALRRMLSDAKIPCRRIDARGPNAAEAIRVDTMHLAKGLEFKAVLLLDCGAAIIPDPATLAGADPQELEATLERERQLLYVAMTRARDELIVGWSGKPSAFIEPLLKYARG